MNINYVFSIILHLVLSDRQYINIQETFVSFLISEVDASEFYESLKRTCIVQNKVSKHTTYLISSAVDFP